MDWTGRNVVVTGAAGFIGSHVAEELVRRGANVRAFVRYTSGGSWGWLDSSELADQMEVFAGDVRDPETLVAAMDGVDTVFHLAALIAIPYSYVTPLAYVRTKVEGTTNVLEAARTAGVGRIVHTSTSEVYGTAQTVPIAETHPLVGQSPYSASKIGADKIAESFHAAFELPVVILRPFNTYGPRQSARAVIPTIITQALAGPALRLGSTDPRRDLTFAEDTAAGFVAAAAAGEAAVGRTVQLGTGEAVSVGEIVDMVGSLLGTTLEVETDEARVRPEASEVRVLVSDPSRARELLRWEPQVPLREGLERTLRWIEANQARFRTGDYVI